MMRVLAWVAFLFCLLLVLFAESAMQAAQMGLSLWWNTLLPTLFPFFACATLMEKTGALHMLAHAFYPLSKKLRISHYALPVLFLGGISGYPSGARLCGMLEKANCIDAAEAERLGTVCNLCSPMFLIGAVASGMFQDARLFAPLALGHYGGAVLIALLLQLLRPIRPAQPRMPPKVQGEPLYRSLPGTIANGMGDMLKVGGTVVFFLVLAQLLTELGVLHILGKPLNALFPFAHGAVPVSQGLLLGLLEMTGGCHLVLQSGLPLRTAAMLCSFLISFGGLSIFVQAMAFVQFQRPLRYLLTKLSHGVLAAAITYFAVSKHAGAVEVFSSQATPYITNAFSGLSIFFAGTLGVATAFLLALLLGKRRRAR